MHNAPITSNIQLPTATILLRMVQPIAFAVVSVICVTEENTLPRIPIMTRIIPITNIKLTPINLFSFNEKIYRIDFYFFLQKKQLFVCG